MHSESPGVKKYPKGKPCDVNMDKRHTAGISSDGVSHAALYASLAIRFQPKLNYGANVTFNHLGKRRIILLAVVTLPGTAVLHLPCSARRSPKRAFGAQKLLTPKTL